MASISFLYNGIETIIQCTTNEKMEDICKKFSIKINNNINNLQFLYGGKKIDFNLKFFEQANSLDKERKQMNILVYENNNINNNSLKVSKDIICPKCGELCRIKINDYKIKLYECKNKHEINNISLNEYENLQKIDESKIICNNCNKINKNESYNKIFYKCLN